MIKPRLVLPALASASALALIAGCGDDETGSDPAGVAPPETLVFVEAKVQPTGELKANVEGLAERAGVDELGQEIVSYLERQALDSDQEIDFEKQIAPWLGETAGVFVSRYEHGDFEGSGFAVAATDTGEAQEFLDELAASEDPSPSEESYEGIDYTVDPDDGESVGIVGGFVVSADEEDTFKAAVDASGGDSLAGSDSYQSIPPSAPESSLADVYVNLGGVIEADESVDPEAVSLFEAVGVELEETSFLASLIPGADNVEIEIAGRLGQEAEDAVPGTDAGKLLGSMPASSVAAIGAGDLGGTLGELIDTIDEEGIPGEIPAGALKGTMKRAGIDLDQITGNLGDAAVYAKGRNGGTLSGALVVEADNGTEASNTVSNIGTLLRANGTPGVTAVTGKASGFSVRNEDLGRLPLVVAAKGARVAIGYGLPATLKGLESESGPTLSGTRAYNEALNALGSTPIVGFAAGSPAYRLVEGLLEDAGEKEELEELAPYLSKVPFLAVGSETKEDVARLRLILGVTK